MYPAIIHPLYLAFKEASTNGISLNLFNPLYENNFLILVWVAIGLLFFAQFSPKRSWLVRIPMAFTLGYGLGMSIPATFEATILKQMESTILTRETFSTLSGGIAQTLIIIGVLSTLTYFFFSREHKGILKHISTVGTVVIMIGFGASFGYTVMGRVSLAIGRFNFLFIDWLGIIK
jgi:lipoprotein signal peptidase